MLWSRALGQGYSGFVASEGRLYTQYQTLAGQFVVCLDAETGRAIWEYRYEWAYESMGLYPGPRATPTLAEGRVYFAAPSGLVGCLSTAGELLWSVNLVEKFAGRGTGFGFAGTPVVRRGRVLLCVGGPGASMAALDARTGATVWQAGDDPASYVPAMPIEFEGREQVVGFLENAIVSYDLAAGRPLWRRALLRGYNEHAAWPVYREPYLWLSGPFRSGSQLLELTGGEAPQVRPVWQTKLLSNDVCSSALADGCLFGFDLRDAQAKLHRPSRGEFRCLDFVSGAQRWSTDRVGQANVLVADGKLILFDDRGELILARVNTQRYEELARVSLLGDEINWTAPPCTAAGCTCAISRGRFASTLAVRNLLERNGARSAACRARYSAGRLSRPDSAVGHRAGIRLRRAGAEVAERLASGRTGAVGHRLAGDSAAFHFGTGDSRPSIERRRSETHCSRAGARTWRRRHDGAELMAGRLHVHLARLLVRAVPSAVRPGAATKNCAGAGEAGPQSWPAGVALLAFLAGCAGYYLLCRQLSLVTEWAFLCGFAAATPIACLRRWLSARTHKPSLALLLQATLTLVEFSAYYWASVAVLLWRCRLA